MTALPSSSLFNGSSVKQRDYKNATLQLLNYLNGLLGSTGLSIDARAALGLSGMPVNYTDRGNWATNQDYVVNDVVIESGIAYVCEIAHHSGTFSADEDAGNWTVKQGATLAQLAASSGASLLGFILGLTGAVSRTVQDKLRDGSVSLKDGGAVGDGVAHDSAAVQVVFNWGKEIRVGKDETYLLDAKINFHTPGQKVIGENNLTSVFQALSASYNLFETDVTSTEHVEWINLRFNGAATDDSTVQFAILASDTFTASHMLVYGCVFSGVDSAHGLNNVCKWDSSNNYCTGEKNYIERLWGNISGTGYGFLTGQVTGCKILHNISICSSGRGRHALAYISDGGNYCVVSYNICSNCDEAPIQQYSDGVQPACEYNKYIGNTTVSCNQAHNSSSGDIIIAGHSVGALIDGHTSINSGANGLIADGTLYGDTLNTKIINSNVINSWFSGIALIAADGGTLHNVYVSESSQSAADSYPNINLVSDTTSVGGPFDTKDWTITSCSSSGATKARSALTLNGSGQTGIIIGDCRFPVCHGGYAVENPSNVPFQVNGVYRYKTSAWTPGTVTAGTNSTTTTFTTTGLNIGDFVEAVHDDAYTHNYVTTHAAVTSANTTTVWIRNDNTSDQTIASAVVYITGRPAGAF